MTISVIILTFNSERTIGKTIESAAKISDDIHIVDSYSTDRTLEIIKQYSISLAQHPFENYGSQRNWAIANLPLKYDWELHLDADERLTDELINELKQLTVKFPEDINGFYIGRIVHFMDRPIEHGGMHKIFHLRLFRHGKGRCENRKYDQHFYADGATANLQGAFIDDIRMSLSEWTFRHNRWADAEVNELVSTDTAGRISPDLTGTPVQKKRFLRGIYNDTPLFVRPFLLFFYRYFLRMGFLDGKEGLVFFVLQTFWFRFLIDAKLLERQLEESKSEETIDKS
jgi:glycosyltransferase involved in cell wall biosynthesis